MLFWVSFFPPPLAAHDKTRTKIYISVFRDGIEEALTSTKLHLDQLQAGSFNRTWTGFKRIVNQKPTDFQELRRRWRRSRRGRSTSTTSWSSPSPPSSSSPSNLLRLRSSIDRFGGSKKGKFNLRNSHFYLNILIFLLQNRLKPKVNKFQTNLYKLKKNGPRNWLRDLD